MRLHKLFGVWQVDSAGPCPKKGWGNDMRLLILSLGGERIFKNNFLFEP